jgi:hypothetical protein
LATVLFITIFFVLKWQAKRDRRWRSMPKNFMKSGEAYIYRMTEAKEQRTTCFHTAKLSANH